MVSCVLKPAMSNSAGSRAVLSRDTLGAAVFHCGYGGSWKGAGRFWTPEGEGPRHRRFPLDWGVFESKVSRMFSSFQARILVKVRDVPATLGGGAGGEAGVPRWSSLLHPGHLLSSAQGKLGFVCWSGVPASCSIPQPLFLRPAEVTSRKAQAPPR